MSLRFKSIVRLNKRVVRRYQFRGSGTVSDPGSDTVPDPRIQTFGRSGSEREEDKRNPAGRPQERRMIHKGWWGEEDLNLRRLRRRVYSPLPLATRASPRTCSVRSESQAQARAHPHRCNTAKQKRGARITSHKPSATLHNDPRCQGRHAPPCAHHALKRNPRCGTEIL